MMDDTGMSEERLASIKGMSSFSYDLPDEVWDAIEACTAEIDRLKAENADLRQQAPTPPPPPTCLRCRGPIRLIPTSTDEWYWKCDTCGLQSRWFDQQSHALADTHRRLEECQ
jgi:hypothetical protein